MVAPTAVSPLIRFCRYGLLITGFIYGANHATTYNEIEESRRKKDAAAKAKAAQAKASQDALVGLL